MNTGENEQELRKIIDMTRMISIIILLLHFYYYCYSAFEMWQLTSTLTSRLIQNVYATGLFSSFTKSKIIAFIFLLISFSFCPSFVFAIIMPVIVTIPIILSILMTLAI